MAQQTVTWFRPIRRQLIERFASLLTTQDRDTDFAHDWVNALILDALKVAATDIHISHQSGGVQLRLRIDGVLLDVAQLTTEQGDRLIRSLKLSADMQIVNSFRPASGRRDFRSGSHNINLRLTSIPTICGEKVVIRVLNPERLERAIHTLGLGEHEFGHINAWLRRANGMVLVTGPTGAGKTTTLYSLMTELRKHEISIGTIEDPVEYQLDGITQVQVDEKHDLSFAEAIRTLLRLDADLLMLGEIRDEPSARAAIGAASSGRCLISTLHSRDAVGAVTSLRNLKINDFEIATSLEMVIAQRLVRTLCTHCRKLGPLGDEERNWLAQCKLPFPQETWQAVGCDKCRRVGYQGQTGVFEVWQLEESDRDQLLRHGDEFSIRTALAHRGHRPLLIDGLQMVAAGETTLQEIYKLGSLYVPPDDSHSRMALNSAFPDSAAGT